MKSTIKKAVEVTFENFFFKKQTILIEGTINIKKAIKEVKKDQCNRRCLIIDTKVIKN